MFLCMYICVDEKEFIIDQLAKIIKDQSYRMQNNLQDSYPIPLDQIDDNKQAFTYDLASHLPEINTGNQEIPFAVLPNDRRYHQSGSLVGGGQLLNSTSKLFFFSCMASYH
jgi:hypothetical protein